MYENIWFISVDLIFTTRKFSMFFKINTTLAKVEFVVNGILEYVSGNPACISFFFPLKFFTFCKFLIYFHICLFLVADFRKSPWGIVFFYLWQHIFSIRMRAFGFVLFTVLRLLIYLDFWNDVWTKQNPGIPRIDQ